jgi:hypothetical protein
MFWLAKLITFPWNFHQDNLQLCDTFDIPTLFCYIEVHRNPDFSEFRPELIKKASPELITKAWPEPELCRFQRDRISNVFVSKVTVRRNLDYAREMYTINTSLWRLTFVNLFILTFVSSLLDDEVSACLAADKVTYDYMWLNKLVPVPAGTYSQFRFRPELKKSVPVHP